MPERRLTDQELADELLLRRTGQIIAEELDAEIEALLADDSIQLPPEEVMAAVGQRIEQAELAANRKRRRTGWAKRVSKYAACIAMCLIGAATLSFHTSAQARESISNLVLQNFGQYSEVYTQTSAPLGKPFGWDLDYYPTWLPEGYQFDMMFLDDDNHEIRYVNKTGHVLAFNCATIDKAGYDIEDRISEVVSIKNKNAHLFTSDSKTDKLLVIVNTPTIAVHGSVSYDDIIHFAESIHGLD